MDANDRAAIERLFQRMEEFERTAPERDADADAFIAERLRHQPSAAYFLAQTVVAQEQALEQAQSRLAAADRNAPPAGQPAFQSPWSRPRTGGGFLAGAAQTAMGVAGGVLLANALGGLFAGDAQAEEAAVDEGDFGGFDDSEF
jgi:uncharacterized protein